MTTNRSFLEQNKRLKRPTAHQQVDLESIKKLKSFESNSDMYESLRANIYMKHRSVSEPQSDFITIPKTLSPKKTAQAIEEVCDIAQDENGSIYIMNYDTMMMDNSFEFFKEIIRHVTNDVYKNHDFDVKELASFVRQVQERFIKSKVRRLVKRSSSQVVLNNCIIDLRQCSVEDLEQIKNKIDVTSRLACNFLPLDAITDATTKEQALYYRTIINRLVDDWTDGDEDKKLLFWQIMIACLEGNNKGVVVVLQGPGGNGKSTFMKIIAKICSSLAIDTPNITIQCGLHQYNDDNVIGKVSASTHVILGDDAPSNLIINDVILSRIKTLTTPGSAFTVNMKYQPAHEVFSNAVMIQSTNTNLRFTENSNATFDRLAVFHWTKNNYRRNPTDEFDLESLLNEQDFIDQFATMAIEKAFEIGYFTKFHISQKMREETADLINDEDIVFTFMNDHTHLFKYYEKLPLTLLYQAFVDYSTAANAHTRPMSFKSFIKRIDLIADKFDMSLFQDDSDSRANFCSKKDYISRSLALLLAIDDAIVKSRYLVNRNDNLITPNDIDEFETQLNHLDTDHEFTDREKVLVAILIKKGNTLAMQYQGDIL